MFDWLADAWQWVSGIPNSVSQWVTGLLTTLYTYVANWIQSVWNGAVDLYNALVGFINSLEYWAYSMFAQLWSWLQQQIPGLINWVVGLYNYLLGYVESILSWAGSEIGKLYAFISGLIDDIYQWILDNIWNPIFGEIAAIWRWITTKGEFMFALLTNPLMLLQWLGHYLLIAWIGLIRKYAPIFVRWLMHVMLSMTDIVGTILEDILTAIL